MLMLAHLLALHLALSLDHGVVAARHDPHHRLASALVVTQTISASAAIAHYLTTPTSFQFFFLLLLPSFGVYWWLNVVDACSVLGSQLVALAQIPVEEIVIAVVLNK